MKRGLVIGKFMPVHKGHLLLIDFASGHCDELIVSMSYTHADPIDPQLRFAWLELIFRNDPKIKPAIIHDVFDDESMPLDERTRIWAEIIRKSYPPIDVVFSSEAYSQPLARHLGAENVLFDIDRKKVPVSATLIRRKPFEHWKFIPPEVRPYFVKKICFFGPESTGKTQMAEVLADKYQTEWIPEVARELITTNDFTVDDIIRIGIAHHKRIEQKLRSANKLLFCDTDAITTQIYSQYYLGVIPPLLRELETTVKYDHYFLFDVDVPWIADGLRDLGHKRTEMFAVFRDALDRRSLKHTLVSGN